MTTTPRPAALRPRTRMMARPVSDAAIVPGGTSAGSGAALAARVVGSRRLPSTRMLIAATGGLALTALAFATGALGSPAPADSGTLFARSAASSTPVVMSPAPAGTPAPTVVASVQPPSTPAPSVAASAQPASTPQVAGIPAWAAASAPPATPAPSATPSPSASPSASPTASDAPAALGAAGTRSGSAPSSSDIALLGGAGAGFDPLDLISKGAIVVALLYVTLRVLRRMQGGTARGTGRIQVLESRPLAAKASLHLVEIGDRRLVVGLTPAGMVSLAELGAEDLPDLEPGLASTSARIAAPGSPALAGLQAAIRGGASFAASLDGAVGAVRAGLGSARSRIGSAR